MHHRRILCAAACALATIAPAAHAADFELTFSDFEFPGVLADITPQLNRQFASRAGVTFENAYLFRDTRLSSAGAGNGTLATWLSGNTEAATVHFVDGVQQLRLDFVALAPTRLVVYGADDRVAGTATVESTGDIIRSQSLAFSASGGNLISRLTFSSIAGMAGILGMGYDFDGTADGVHEPVVVPAVPEPSTTALLALALAGLVLVRTSARGRRPDSAPTTSR